MDKVLVSESLFIEFLVNRQGKVGSVDKLFTILEREGIETCITGQCNARITHYSSVLGTTDSIEKAISGTTILPIESEAFQEARSYQSPFTCALELVCAQRAQVSVILSDCCDNFIDCSPVPVLSTQDFIDRLPLEKRLTQTQSACRPSKKPTLTKEAVGVSKDANACTYSTYALTVPSGVNPNVYYRYLQDSFIDIYDDWHR